MQQARPAPYMLPMSLFLRTALFLALAAPLAAQNVVVSLLAPLAAAAPGGEVRVDLVILNPTPAEVTYETPLTLEGRLTDGTRGWPVLLRGQAGNEAPIAARSFSYRAFVFTVPSEARGRLALEIAQPQPARAIVDVATEPSGQRKARVVSAPLSSLVPNQPVLTAIQRSFAGRFSALEPVYFIYGPDAPGAKFQFSFKYRLFGERAELGSALPALRGLYLGYTQRSLWDIGADSSPFFDTSYMPELFFESQRIVDPGAPGGFKFLGYHAGLRHESNGRDGPASRSLNILYFRPAFAFGRLDSWNLLLVPRFFVYVSDVANNPDIRDYRGNAELVVAAGRNDRFALAVTARLGQGGDHAAIQADLTIPLRYDRLFDFATYFLVQYWDGYGESLLDYRERTTTVRAGFSLVR